MAYSRVDVETNESVEEPDGELSSESEMSSKFQCTPLFGVAIIVEGDEQEAVVTVAFKVEPR